MAAACVMTAPSFAERTPPTDTGYEANYSYRSHDALFGSREIYSDSLWRFPQWTHMLARSAAEAKAADHVCHSRHDTRCVPQEWNALLEEMRGRNLRQKIGIANDAMNRQPYVPTERNWHRSMYWETAFQFLRYGGQCQDYAIAKYELLRAAGVPAKLMRMVVLRDTAIGLDHAVLVVYVDYVPMLLDNLRHDIVPASRVHDYRPYYSINENGWWFHFGGRAMFRLAARYR